MKKLSYLVIASAIVMFVACKGAQKEEEAVTDTPAVEEVVTEPAIEEEVVTETPAETPAEPEKK